MYTLLVQGDFGVDGGILFGRGIYGRRKGLKIWFEETSQARFHPDWAEIHFRQLI